VYVVVCVILQVHLVREHNRRDADSPSQDNSDGEKWQHVEVAGVCVRTQDDEPITQRAYAGSNSS
jgi:hypothetical protein